VKVFIPGDIQASLKTAEPGSLVLGAFSREHNVATVTGLLSPADTEQGMAGQPVLAVVGRQSGDQPLFLDRRAGNGWFDGAGAPLEVETYDNGQFFKRTPFDSQTRAHLQKKRVLIVGAGSVGAPMGLELAKAGVGGIIVLDKDILEIHNCMRHVLGVSYIGWPKVTAFAHFLKGQAPMTECIPVHGDLFSGRRRRLQRMMEETRPTHILAVTDSLRVQYLCQRLALHYQLPLMAVWCDNNAVEGEIFMWEPGQAPAWKPGRAQRGCYACMRDPDTVTITRSASFDYSSDDPDSYGGEPALGTFINRINNIAAIFLTAWMLGDCPAPSRLAGILDEHYRGKGLQYIRLGGPYPFEVEGQLTAKEPWAVEWYRVMKREACPFCGNQDANREVLFPEDAPHVDAPECWEAFQKVS